MAFHIMLLLHAPRKSALICTLEYIYSEKITVLDRYNKSLKAIQVLCSTSTAAVMIIYECRRSTSKYTR